MCVLILLMCNNENIIININVCININIIINV